MNCLSGRRCVKKVIRTGVVISLLTLAGCASSVRNLEQEAILPEIDVIQMKENSDEALRLAQEARLDVDAIRTRVTDLDNRIILLSEEVSSVSIAKIEEIETKLSLLIEAYKDLHSQVKTLESTPVRTARSGPATPTFSPSSASALLSSSPEYDLYQNGLRVYNSRNYEEAVRLFTDLIKKFPQGKWTDNAQYWVGESYYALGDFANAINAFRSVLAFSGSSKADDSQYKIGLSFIKMGQAGPAKTELQTLVDRYPASEYVARAKKHLQDLK